MGTAIWASEYASPPTGNIGQQNVAQRSEGTAGQSNGVDLRPAASTLRQPDQAHTQAKAA